MPIGKDSIRKRVIGAECAECGACDEKPAQPVAEEKPAKAPTKRTSTKKTPAKKKTTVAEEPASTVLTNVSPEVVEAVVGHKEGEQVEHVQILDDMPSYLL